MKEISKEAKDALEDQYKLSQEICYNSNINIVTCGNCGNVFLHTLKKNELTCPFCLYHDEISSFPDLFYQPIIKGTRTDDLGNVYIPGKNSAEYNNKWAQGRNIRNNTKFDDGDV